MKHLRKKIEEILERGTPRLQYMGSIPEMTDKLESLFKEEMEKIIELRQKLK